MSVPPAFVGGFTAAEGHFGASGRRFWFSLQLGATDGETCRQIAEVLGVGRLYRRARRQEHFDDEVSFQVQSVRELVEVVVPFMDRHLPPSHKREQYRAWRAALLHHWEHDARRPGSCTEPGCAAPRRAHGLCRHHLWIRDGM